MATETVSVAAGGDDGFSTPSVGFFDTLTRLEVGDNGGTDIRSSWMRFLSVNVPNGATINSAYVEVVAYGFIGTPDGNMTNRIFAEDADNPSAPTTQTDHAGRTRTTAFTDWTPTVWSTGTTYQSPDIASVIQEIVDRAGWADGNALQILMDDQGTVATRVQQMASYEHSTYAPPKLVIDYTEPLSTITDPALSDADTLNTDSFVRLISDPSLSDADSLYLDTLVQLVTITDQLLSASNTLNVDVLTRSPLTDQFLSDADTLNVDVLTGDVNVFPTWIWCFVRQDGNLFLAPRKSLRSWRNPNADIVSEFFQFSIDLETYAMSKVAAAWAANAAADTATLKAAIDSALSSAGFKDRYGNPL